MKRYSTIVPFVAALLALPTVGFAEEEKALDADDLFGGGGGYFHPYITTVGVYDDNVYRTANDTISDYATIIKPGIWVAVPGTRERTLNLNTSTLAPGGLGVVEDHGEVFKRMQGFLHYGAGLTRYEEVNDSDTDDQRVDGYFQYNLKGGLTLELLDMYLDGHDERGQGLSGDLDTFKSNLLGGRVTYDMGTKFRLRGEYGHFNVDYDTAENRLRDRDDDKYSAYLYYKLTGKSSIFAEYDFVDISYDALESLQSEEHYIWGGYRWRLSEKTIGELKVGSMTKDYSFETADDASDFVLKGWLDYEFTGKSRLKLIASRTVEEPDNYSSLSALTNEVSVVLSHDLTSKIELSLEGGYGRTTYDGEYSYHGVVGEREDDEYTGEVSLDYKIQRWLGVGVSYTYFDRESSFADLSYTDNRFLVSLTLSM